MAATETIAEQLATFVRDTRFSGLPASVRCEAPRALVNWMGCVLGGCREDVSRIAASVASETGRSSLIGHGTCRSVADAAFVNSVSASALSFDDTHLATVAHPTGPVASAIFSCAQERAIDGRTFLTALVLGIEITCRLASALLLSPASPNLGLYVQGVVGPVGVAVGLGHLLGFERDRLVAAIGLATAMAGGTRATHGSMAGLMVPAFGALSGVRAALMAQAGATCSPDAIEGQHGLLDVFAKGADPSRVVDGLGARFEMLQNSYKPYPAGIVLHPAVDACLELARGLGSARIARIELKVHRLAKELTDRRHPENPLEAQLSVQHWAATALAGGETDARALRQDRIDAPAIVELRDLVDLDVDPALARDSARVTLHMESGEQRTAFVEHARGSLQNPLTDEDLDRKFLSQVGDRSPSAAASALIGALRGIEDCPDVGQTIGALADTEFSI